MQNARWGTSSMLAPALSAKFDLISGSQNFRLEEGSVTLTLTLTTTTIEGKSTEEEIACRINASHAYANLAFADLLHCFRIIAQLLELLAELVDLIRHAGLVHATLLAPMVSAPVLRPCLTKYLGLSARGQ